VTLKTEKELEEVIDRVLEQSDKQVPRYPGMTYEEGVENALRWVIGDADDADWPFNKEK